MNWVDRARVILTYLATNDVAGTPNIIHHQLELYRDADWTLHTTRRRLNDFQAHGLVEYYPDIGKGYYGISDAGRDAVKAGISDERLDEIVGTSVDAEDAGGGESRQ